MCRQPCGAWRPGVPTASPRPTSSSSSSPGWSTPSCCAPTWRRASSEHVHVHVHPLDYSASSVFGTAAPPSGAALFKTSFDRDLLHGTNGPGEPTQNLLYPINKGPICPGGVYCFRHVNRRNRRLGGTTPSGITLLILGGVLLRRAEILPRILVREGTCVWERARGNVPLPSGLNTSWLSSPKHSALFSGLNPWVLCQTAPLFPAVRYFSNNRREPQSGAAGEPGH